MININTNSSNAATNASNVKNAFDNNVTGYFGKIEIDTTSSDTYKYVKFYLDSSSENPDVTINIPTSTSFNPSNVTTLTVGGTTYNVSYSNYSYADARIYRVICTDNAVVLQTNHDGSESATNIVFCKSVNGHILMQFYGSSSITAIGPNHYSSADNVKIMDLDEQATTTYNHNINYNNNNQVLGVPFVSLTGGSSDNVFLPITRCFAGIVEPFKYQINGENYVGIGYNSIIIKSE